MDKVKTSEVLDILDRLQFFEGQRAGRELWSNKPIEVQEEDLENYNRDIDKIRDYVQYQDSVLQKIVEKLEDEMMELRKAGCYLSAHQFKKAIDIVEKVGGINE